MPRADADCIGAADASLMGRLRRVVAARPEQTAISYADGALTYAAFWDQVELAAKALIASGVLVGDRVASWSPNRPECIVIQCAALLCRASVVHLDPELDGAEAMGVLEQLPCRHVFVRANHDGKQYPAILRALRRERGFACEVTVHGRPERFERVLPGGWLDFLDSGRAVTSAALAGRESANGSEDASRVVAFCAGREGAPVKLSAAALSGEARPFEAEAAMSWAVAAFSEPTVLATSCFGALLAGGELSLTDAFTDAEDFLRLVRTHRFSQVFAPRTRIEAVSQAPNSAELLGNCRLIESGSKAAWAART
ncbi:MAG TPA: AMP-binding protein [Polyangiaceae bacterium]|nr:AMP-binding protein [Polyangiaceae bacterium]